MSDRNTWTDKDPGGRRRFPRYKTAVPVELRPEGSTVATHTQTSDLSLGGCYIEMNFALAAKTKLHLVLWVEDEKVTTDAVVVTHDPGFGNGICFLNMSPEDQAKLKKHLDTLDR
jgi:c-di-GMP-binding flagellar brake protein YcgR